MLRTFAIAIAGAGIFASLPLTSARACDDDCYPCPIRSEALIEETVQAQDQLVPDEPQKRVAPQKKAKQPASNEKAHAKRDPRAPAAAKVSKPAASRKQAPDAVTQTPPEAAPAVIASPSTNEQALDDQSRSGSLLATAGTTGRFPQKLRRLRTSGWRRASTLRTPYRMQCKWSTRTTSMSSIARRPWGRLGSTISCGRWGQRSLLDLQDLHCGSVREWDSGLLDEARMRLEQSWNEAAAMIF